jgi:hypothetical protein
MNAASIQPSDLLDTLAARLGSNQVLVESSALAPHLVEERRLYRGSALAVVRPQGHSVLIMSFRA